jgi:hypothetical protein
MTQLPVFDPTLEWQNFHQTYTQFQQGSWDVYFPNLGGSVTSIDDLKETTRQLQALIGEARQSNTPIRAIGSRWSFSKSPATSGWSINSNRLRGRMKIDEATLHPLYPGSSEQHQGLYLFQCGNTVADVNKVLENKSQRRALFTSGAANGQTIAGATANGTHGSALDFGALHDHIVAIHLVTTSHQHWWIERASRPVMDPAWVAALGADRIQDDELFNATLVAIGSFGIIHAVVLETAPRYLLASKPGTAILDEDMWAAIAQLDFSRHPHFEGKRPYFFQAIINPARGEVLINANYREDCPSDYSPKYGLTQNPKSIGPGFDSLSAVGMILDVFNGAIPPLSSILARQLFDMKPMTGTPGMIYGYKAPQLHGASANVAVARPDARRTIETLIQLYEDVGPVPVALGCRYVRKSPALLAFTRFDTTLVVNIDGVDSQRARAYFQAAADRLEAQGIPFTQHWGKINAYTPERVKRAYGANADRWVAARKRILPDAQDRALFDNDYLRGLGLAG